VGKNGGKENEGASAFGGAALGVVKLKDIRTGNLKSALAPLHTFYLVSRGTNIARACQPER
jgi:hypothetical protein